MRKRAILALIVTMCCAMGAVVTACSGSDSSPDNGASQVQSKSVEVVLDGTSKTVHLGQLATVSYKGHEMVSLLEVWKASSDESPLGYVFEAESEDGFRPSSKGDECLPLSGDKLDRGYIDPKTRNVVWDESLGLRGCYNVKNTAKILVTKAVASQGGDGGA